MGGKGGGGDVTTGYKYLMGVQLVPTVGPVDSVNRIIIGEREAWAGSVTDNATININRPELFGGDGREGGVVGDVDIMMGAGNQGRNAYLAAHQGANCSAYRGLLSIVFKSFQWSSGNPYFKSPWIEITRILKGWGDNGVWNVADAKIGTRDMNPAHIIYQCLTQPWGMGYSPSELDDLSFREAATKLKNENFGLSIEWSEQSSVEAFIGDIVDHINGAVGVNLSTGKIKLKLIRDDYVLGDLLELNESNVIEVKSFQRSAYGDSANEVVVTYTDRDQNDKTIAVQNPASIAAQQGSIISVARKYPGIRESELAARVAMRELKTLSTPLAKMVMVTNRVLWAHEKGDVVRINWPKEGVDGVAYRIIDIDKGTLANGAINVTLVEDIFGLPNASYSLAPDSLWVDTVVPPIPVDSTKVIEAPYWEIMRNISAADQAMLDPDYGFGVLLASRGAVRSALNFILASSSDDVKYKDGRTGHFSPAGSLVNSITAVGETLTLTGATDLDSVVLSVDGGYAYVENECLAVISANPTTGVVAVKRGILDTVPRPHIAGTKVWFYASKDVAFDQTERTSGEVVYYRPRPVSGAGTLSLDDAETETLVLNNRASRPYPPGKFQINGQYYPATIPGPEITATWAHRDRLAQTVDFVDYSTGNIGPELGTSYRIRLYNGPTLLRTYDIDGATTSWSYPATDDTADGNLAAIRIELCSVRNNLESLQAHSFTVNRISATGSVVVGGKPAAPVLAAVDASFAVNLSWVLGDPRTDMDKFEIRVATEPVFSQSDVLQYVEYPTLNYVHNLATPNSFRWYWIRVIDVNGVMSDWSDMVSGRGVTSTVSPTQMLEDINDLLTNGSGTSKIEMQADRFSIVAPDGSKTPFAVVDTGGGNFKTLLNSDVLIGGNVNIANLKTGSLPSDVIMKLGGGTIELDGAGEIRVFKGIEPNSDFVRLTAGEIRFLRYMEGAYRTYNYLSRIEAGVASNGTTVLIPGYWKSQPRIIVSPASLGLFKATYMNQDQSVTCLHSDLVETFTGSGRWQFKPVATLNLAANTGLTTVNETSGALSVNTWTSSTKVTSANCTSITPSVSFLSYRGNGSGMYYRRTVRWRVEYYNGSTWVTTAVWTTVAMGDQTTNAVASNSLFTFPSAGTWQWRIYAEAYDTDGTLFGTGGYNYTQETVTAVNVTNTFTQSNITGYAIYPTYNAPSGTGEIYQITYAATPVVRAKMTVDGATDNLTTSLATGYTSGAHYTIDGSYNHQNGSLGQIAAGKVGTTIAGIVFSGWSTWAPGAQTHTVSGSNLTFNNKFWSLATKPRFASNNWMSVEENLTSLSATIYRRTPITNSTTPSNTFNVGSFTWSLSSAQVLATGSLNWLAVGD